MGKIFCLMGKSASGKDTVYQRLLEDKSLGLKRIVPYTTRPVRSGEIDGETYNFCSDEEARRLLDEGHVIEMRSYNTMHGVWRYFTADDGQICPGEGSCLLIGTLEVYESLKKFFGEDAVRPLYIWLDDGVRLMRALKREMAQEEPGYAELCRRFLADEEDFSPERLKECKVGAGFENNDIETLLEDIRLYIRTQTEGSAL